MSLPVTRQVSKQCDRRFTLPSHGPSRLRTCACAWRSLLALAFSRRVSWVRGLTFPLDPERNGGSEREPWLWALTHESARLPQWGRAHDPADAGKPQPDYVTHIPLHIGFRGLHLNLRSLYAVVVCSCWSSRSLGVAVYSVFLLATMLSVICIYQQQVATGPIRDPVRQDMPKADYQQLSPSFTAWAVIRLVHVTFTDAILLVSI